MTLRACHFLYFKKSLFFLNPLNNLYNERTKMMWILAKTKADSDSELGICHLQARPLQPSSDFVPFLHDENQA